MTDKTTMTSEEIRKTLNMKEREALYGNNSYEAHMFRGNVWHRASDSILKSDLAGITEVIDQLVILKADLNDEQFYTNQESNNGSKSELEDAINTLKKIERSPGLEEEGEE